VKTPSVGENVGEYAINIGSLALADNGSFKSSNYELSYTGANFEITAKDVEELELTLEVTSYVYDGTDKEPEVTVTYNGETLVEGIDYDISYDNNTNAGTATVTVTGKGNYAGSASENFTITPRNITFVAGDANKVYDGTSLTSGNYTIKSGTTLVSGHTETVTTSGSITNVGTVDNEIATVKIKDASENDVTSNYVITTEKGTLEVTIRTLNVVANANQGKVYGTVEPVLTYTYSNVANEETPGFTGALVREVGENVGEYAISIRSLALADNGSFESSNYELSYTGDIFKITAKDVEELELE
jgi:hypothetical protein